MSEEEDYSKIEVPSCTCCTCEVEEEQDICIVEASGVEKSACQGNEITKSVWGNVRPPVNLGSYQPIVTARRTEIIRAQLIRNAPKLQKDSKVYCKCEPDLSKIQL